MKFSSILIFSFACCLIFGCRQESRRLLVRPLEKVNKDSIYSQIFPFESHPSFRFEKGKWSDRLTKHTPDTLFTKRLRVKNKPRIPFEMEAYLPAFTLDVVMPDSVRMGEGFYYLLVLKSREGALFSRLWMEEEIRQNFQVRAFQQEVEGLPEPCSQYEEVLQSYFPLEKGNLKFDFYYYDSLLLTRQIVVF